MIKIDIFYILLGIILGFTIIYIITPSPKIIIKYPTVDNINSTVYVDDNGMCYKYYAKEIPCKNT